MSWIEIPQDKRHAMRVHPHGTVVLRHHEEVLRGHIVDLATGGVGLHADHAFGADAARAGQPVTVDISLAGRTATWTLVGHVVRARTITQVIAIAFDDVPGELEDYVQDQLLDAVEHDALSHVVLVAADTGRRAAIAHAFRTAGCHVVETSTCESATQIVEDGDDDPDVILLSDTTPELVAEHMREVLLTSSQRDRITRWLGASNLELAVKP